MSQIQVGAVAAQKEVIEGGGVGPIPVRQSRSGGGEVTDTISCPEWRNFAYNGH